MPGKGGAGAEGSIALGAAEVAGGSVRVVASGLVGGLVGGPAGVSEGVFGCVSGRVSVGGLVGATAECVAANCCRLAEPAAVAVEPAARTAVEALGPAGPAAISTESVEAAEPVVQAGIFVERLVAARIEGQVGS